jgi:hypothetical protein
MADESAVAKAIAEQQEDAKTRGVTTKPMAGMERPFASHGG